LDVLFASERFAKVMDSNQELAKKFGAEMAKRIRRRLDDLSAAESLETMRNLPGRCHELEAERKGQLAVDLVHPQRLILEPYPQPPPVKPDGGLDWTQVTAVTVLEVVDYH
jgi:plasmid maintenance system killer protein